MWLNFSFNEDCKILIEDCKNFIHKSIAFIGIFFIVLVFYYGPSYKNNSNFNCLHKTIKINILNSYNLTTNEFSLSIQEKTNLLNYGIYYLTDIKTLCISSINKKDELKFINGLDKSFMVPKYDISDCSSNVLANIQPQLSCFNRGIWKSVENYLRNNYKNNYIITAPEYNINFIKNPNIPIGFYKIVLSKDYKILKSIYIKHTIDNCYKNWYDVSDYKKLPHFISCY